MNLNYYIKDGNKSCHFVGHSKLKPIGYNASFEIKSFSDLLLSIVGPTDVAKSSDNASSAIYTSVKDKSQEESMKKKIYKDTGGQKYNCDDS